MTTLRILVTFALLAACTSWTKGEERGLVADYQFDQGNGARAVDASERGHDGTIHGAGLVRRGDGFVLEFDGEDDYVEVAPGSDFTGRDEGAFELWFRPRRWQGGLVDWSCGSAWNDIRFTLAFNTYQREEKEALFLINLADGNASRQHQIPLPPKDTWTHLAVSFRGQRATVYRDGLVQAVFSGPPPKREGLALWFGKCQGLGQPFFAGQIDQVRIYNRALAREEVLARYKAAAAAMGKDTTSFDRPSLRLVAMPEPGWMVATVEHERMGPLPVGAVLEAIMGQSGGDRTEVVQENPLEPGSYGQRVKLDASGLVAGKYEVVVTIKAPDGRTVGKPSRTAAQWPGRAAGFEGVGVLNNLVWELVRTSPTAGPTSQRTAFQNPLRRWAFVSCTARVGKEGKLSISIPSVAAGQKIIVVTGPAEGTYEAMRPLPAGKHELEWELAGAGAVEQVVVRSVPELIYAQYGCNPHTNQFGPYTHTGAEPNFGTAFIDRYVLPNINTLVFSPGEAEGPFLQRWRARGGRSLGTCGAPASMMKTDEGWTATAPLPDGGERRPITAEAAYEFIRRTAGFTHPGLDGSIADEFGNSEPHCLAYAEAIRKLAAAPQYRGRRFYPYANHLYTGPEGIEMVKAVVEAESMIPWERYLKTQPDEQAAKDFLQRELVDRAWAYRESVPRSLEHLAVCLGYFSAPNEFLNTSPAVNYKKYLDMQMNLVANDPAFWGTYGLMSYLASYADEECIRWLHSLFRYYGIQGNTAPRCTDPYRLTHMVNGDFEDGLNGWTIEPAEEGSLRVTKQEGLGWLQGRYPTTPEGDTGLVMVRSGLRPNIVRQQVVDLEPGRLYSFRMFCSDHEDMSRQESLAIGVALEGVELIEDSCFNHVGHSCYSHSHGPYNVNHPAWFNYIWRVFRAKAPTAEIILTDWKSPCEPGARIGQKLIVNFAHVQPYFPH